MHARLIDRSVSHTEVVCAPYRDDLAQVLSRECDGTVDTGAVVEYWGLALDDDCEPTVEWRIHLVREVRS